MKTMLTDDHIRTTKESVEKMLKEPNSGRTTHTVQILAEDMLALLSEVEAAREARPPVTIVHSEIIGGVWVWNMRDDVQSAEVMTKKAIERDEVLQAYVYSARLEQEWQREIPKPIAVRKK